MELTRHAEVSGVALKIDISHVPVVHISSSLIGWMNNDEQIELTLKYSPLVLECEILAHWPLLPYISLYF